jgi:hypothetical protein
MTIWVLAELFRDRKEPGEKRLSGRHGCERLETHLREHFQGGRVLPFNTIHRHYKEFNAIRCKKGGEAAADAADKMLANARVNRDSLGWDASTWMALIDPNVPKAMGYNVVLHSPGINDPKTD